MVKIKIDWDEWYPVYFIYNNDNWNSGEELDISEEDLAFVRKASDDFYTAQRILEKLVHPNGR